MEEEDERNYYLVSPGYRVALDQKETDFGILVNANFKRLGRQGVTYVNLGRLKYLEGLNFFCRLCPVVCWISHLARD